VVAFPRPMEFFAASLAAEGRYDVTTSGAEALEIVCLRHG
jgi:hypothetical protein